MVQTVALVGTNETHMGRVSADITIPPGGIAALIDDIRLELRIADQITLQEEFCWWFCMLMEDPHVNILMIVRDISDYLMELKETVFKTYDLIQPTDSWLGVGEERTFTTDLTELFHDHPNGLPIFKVEGGLGRIEFGLNLTLSLEKIPFFVRPSETGIVEIIGQNPTYFSRTHPKATFQVQGLDEGQCLLVLTPEGFVSHWVEVSDFFVEVNQERCDCPSDPEVPAFNLETTWFKPANVTVGACEWADHQRGAHFEDSDQDWNGDGLLDGRDKNGDTSGDGELTWHSGTEHNVCNFTVNQGVTLTIEPGALVRLKKGSLNVKGRLIAQGVRFEAAVANPDPVIALNGPNSAITNCSIHGVRTAVGASASIVGNTIEANGGTDGVTVNGGNPDIRKNRFFDNHAGISVRGGNPTIAENDLSGNAFAISIAHADPKVVNNTITHSFQGISLSESSAEVKGNNIMNCSAGIVVAVSGSPILTENTLEYNGYGISIVGGSPHVFLNSVSHSTDCGIPVTGGSPMIHHNTVQANGDGICLSASAEVYDNQISFNRSNGMVIGAGSPTITGNTIGENAGCGIKHYAGAPSVRGNSICGNGEDCTGCCSEAESYPGSECLEQKPKCSCWECLSPQQQ
jgi:parallel beta-helix repeat protein